MSSLPLNFANLDIIDTEYFEGYEYINCDEGFDSTCNLEGDYYPRQWKSTLDEAKEFCSENSDCRGITRDNGGYEPRTGPGVNYYVAAHELWLRKGSCFTVA